MPTATIQNPTVSVYLNPGESFTIPPNEVWKVYISGEDEFPYIIFNGSKYGRMRRESQTTEGPYVLTGGTSISSDERIYVSGFVIAGY